MLRKVVLVLKSEAVGGEGVTAGCHEQEKQRSLEVACPTNMLHSPKNLRIFIHLPCPEHTLRPKGLQKSQLEDELVSAGAGDEALCYGAHGYTRLCSRPDLRLPLVSKIRLAKGAS